MAKISPTQTGNMLTMDQCDGSIQLGGSLGTMKQDLGLQCSAWKNLSLVLGGNLPGFESFWVHDKKYFMLRRSNEVYRTGNVSL